MSAKDLCKKTILELIDDLKEYVFTQSDEQNDLLMVELFFRSKSALDIAFHITEHILPHEQHIIDKNDDFFVKNKHLFKGLPDDKISYYAHQLTSDRVDDEDKEMIWKYFHTLIKLAKKHKKND